MYDWTRRSLTQGRVGPTRNEVMILIQNFELIARDIGNLEIDVDIFIIQDS